MRTFLSLIALSFCLVSSVSQAVSCSARCGFWDGDWYGGSVPLTSSGNTGAEAYSNLIAACNSAATDFNIRNFGSSYANKCQGVLDAPMATACVPY